ncbi:MAG: transglutaminase family protein [Betaproteobacteria bacterium]|nr:transglutaminase family protein [Betaproteobacteria bacterium]
MLLNIVHDTHYRYTTPVRHSIQVLRLTPRPDPLQRILHWNISAPRRLWSAADAYGNRSHTLVVSEPHEDIRVVAQGVVEVTPPAQAGLLPHAPERLSPLVFLTATALTAADEAVRSFADRHCNGAPTSVEDLLQLATAVAAVLAYRSGITESHTPAGVALAHGFGVCQDHAHLFIACCRLRGVPARYVSGYVEVAEDPHAASHAWAEAWLPDTGWVSVDVTHGNLVTDHHCSLAVGRDFDSASPLRGVRTGGGGEALEVRVVVDTGQQ